MSTEDRAKRTLGDVFGALSKEYQADVVALMDRAAAESYIDALDEVMQWVFGRKPGEPWTMDDVHAEMAATEARIRQEAAAAERERLAAALSNGDAHIALTGDYYDDHRAVAAWLRSGGRGT